MNKLRAVLLCTTIAGATTPAALRAQETEQAPSVNVAGRTGTFATGGDTIFYRVAGSGPPMLLIHGFPLSGELFRSQLSMLSQTHTVITPDLPGFGKSTTGRTRQTDAHYASDMFALLQYLGIQKAVIGGHSMGGQITLEMFRQQPAFFSGMILFDTNPAAASIVEMGEWPAYGRQAEKLGSASIAPPVVGVMVTGAAEQNNPELGTALTDIVSAASPDGVVAGANALATRPDYTGSLAQINVPTLVICGQDDPVYPLPISQMLANGISGSILATITNAAHASMFQRPYAVNQVIMDWTNSNGI